MKLQRSTGILIGVAISLVATVTILEIPKGPQANNGNTLYSFTETDVSEFTVERDDNTLSFIKTDDAWQMTAPEKALADPSSVAFLLNIITSDTIKETISTTPDQLATYGLDTPTAKIQLIVDEESYTLTVGDEDFSSTSLYVMTANDIAESNPVNVHLIPKGLENGIERPVSDWLAKNDDAASEATTDAETTDEPETSDTSSTTENSDDESAP
ncbi:DUF4340 domain-containing protein [Leptothoe sp. EHU-05/26/07-4]